MDFTHCRDACSGWSILQFEPKPTLAEAEKFIADTEVLLADLSVKSGRAAWVQANFITDDTEAIASQANENYIAAATKLAEDVKRFNGMQFPPVLDRKFKLLKLSLFSLSDPKEREEVAKLGTISKRNTARAKRALKPASRPANASPSGKWNSAGDEPGPGGDEGSVESLARSGGSAAAEVHTLRSVAEQGRAGTGVQRYGRDVALQLRHDAGAIRR